VRVAVLGAGGTIAPAIVRDLASSDEVEAMTLLDLDLGRAEATAEEHGDAKATAEQVDASATAGEPGSLAGALADCEVLVNSASYRVNLDAMRAGLEAGCHYLDLGGLYWMTGRQLALDDDFRRAGLLAVLGIGSAPGKTNLMARVAAEQLGGRAEAIHVSAAGRDLDPPSGFSVPYALRTLIDELTMAPVVLRGGEPQEIEPLAAGGTVEFGEPIGAAGTIYTLHSEMHTFGPSFGCREGSFRLSLAPALLERLRELASGSDDEIEAAARSATPASSQTVSVHVVDAAAGTEAVRVRVVTPPHGEWGLGGGVVSTASPAAAAVRMLARGAIEARGVLPPEGCIDPREMFAELEPSGARLEVETSEVVRA